MVTLGAKSVFGKLRKSVKSIKFGSICPQAPEHIFWESESSKSSERVYHDQGHDQGHDQDQGHDLAHDEQNLLASRVGGIFFPQ